LFASLELKGRTEEFWKEKKKEQVEEIEGIEREGFWSVNFSS